MKDQLCTLLITFSNNGDPVSIEVWEQGRETCFYWGP